MNKHNNITQAVIDQLSSALYAMGTERTALQAATGNKILTTKLWYPSVDRYPHTFPSAYSDTMSPICRTDEESLIVLERSDQIRNDHEQSNILTLSERLTKRSKPPPWTPHEATAAS